MKFMAKRSNRKLLLSDYTTVGIVGKLLGNTPITARKWITRGRIPFKHTLTTRQDVIVRVYDIIRYCVLHNIAYDSSMIDWSVEQRLTNHIGTVVLHAVEPPLIESKVLPGVQNLSLRTVFSLLDIDPFTPIILGLYNGLNYIENVITEIQHSYDCYKDDITKRFKPNIYLLISANALDDYIKGRLGLGSIRVSGIHSHLIDIRNDLELKGYRTHV